MEGRAAGNHERPMRTRRSAGRWLIALALAAVACCLALSACGSSSGGGTTGGEGTTAGGPTTGSDTTSSGGGGKGASAEFVGKGENGTLAKEGKESSAAEREAASEALEESFEARAAGDWAGQCASLTKSAVEAVEAGVPKGKKKKGCAANLETLGKQAPKAVLENPMIEPIAVLRISGSQAYAFFHGAKGQDYVMPMEKEGSDWKVGALTPQEAP